METKKEIYVRFYCYSKTTYNGYQVVSTIEEANAIAAEFNKRCDYGEFSYENEDGDCAEVIISEEHVNPEDLINITEETIKNCIKWLKNCEIWEYIPQADKETLINATTQTEASNKMWELFGQYKGYEYMRYKGKHIYINNEVYEYYRYDGVEQKHLTYKTESDEEGLVTTTGVIEVFTQEEFEEGYEGGVLY